MGEMELARTCAALAPGADELTFLREFDNPRIFGGSYNCLKPNNLLPIPDLSMGKFRFICRNHLQSWLTGIGQSIVTR